MFEPGQRVGVAVSGGADSRCLLDVLVALAPRWALRLTVLHVNHLLRGEESEGDERFVRELAAGLGLEVLCRREEVREIAACAGDNLEQAARRIRHDFFLGLVRDGTLDRVAVGHTRSDQAETVLFRLLRGAGTAGLAGIRPRTREGIVRPLIEVSRAEVERYLRDRGLPWREDSTNRECSFARNRIRHDLLPTLERDWNPAIEEVLAATARVAGDEEAYWDGVVAGLAPGNLIVRSPAVLFRTEWLLGLPAAVARRVARKAIERVKGDLRAIDVRHIEMLLELAAQKEGSGRFQAPGLDVFRSFDWMRLAPPGLDKLENRNFGMEVEPPGRFVVPGTGRVIELEVSEESRVCAVESGYNGRESEIDWGRISCGLLLRNWRPGDRYRPVGHANEIKVKSLFQVERIPLWERRNWPILCLGQVIVWAAGFGPAAEFQAQPGSRGILRVRESGETWES
jgi:tRNA(Ile)-lysidine synthase